MNQKNLLFTLLSITLLFFASCKIETTNPSTEVTFGSADIQFIVEANLNTTNDTTKNGTYQLNLEKVSGVTVTATTNRSNFFTNTSGNYQDEVVSGETDANGVVTLKVPVGQRANIQYRVSVSDLIVKQRNSTSVNDEPEDKIASYTNVTSVQVSNGTKEIKKITLALN
jgi:hypothetical protein